MLSKDILQLSSIEFDHLNLSSIGLDLEKDVEKIRLVIQWRNLYNKTSTTDQTKQALEINLERLLCLPTQ